MKSDFTLAFNEIVESRALPKEVVLEALSQALVSAYRRDENVSSNQRVEARIDPTGRAEIMLEKEVTDDVVNEQTEVNIDVARERFPTAEMGDLVMMPVKTGNNFGRIAAQTAKQVILQRIREAERESLYGEFVEREGDLLTGTVQSVTAGAITLSLGRAEAVMPRAQQIPSERYRPHDKVRVYVVEVKKNSRGPQIVVSRAHKNMLRRLLEYEVPEIYNGQVEIKNIAREAGHRSKVAVAALQEGVDPVGACVGMRGIRIQNIVKELSDEKIDVIEWSADSAVFIGKALSPARVSDMLLEEDLDAGRTATVVVPDDQLSLAIGREGQNARLAAKLTGWRIDIKSVSEAALEAWDLINKPALSQMRAELPDMVAEAGRIIEKKRGNRPIQPEEFKLLTDFVKMAERRLLAAREESRSERRSAMERVRKLIPEHAFLMTIGELELDDDINQALGRIENVGELMVRMLSDEEGLRVILEQGGAKEDAMEAIRYALDDLVILRPEEPALAPAPVVEEVTAAPVVEPQVEVQPELPVVEALPEIDEEEEVLPAFIEPEPVYQARTKAPEVGRRVVEPEPAVEDEAATEEARRRKTAKKAHPEREELPVVEEPDAEARDDKRKSAKKKKRELVFDEDRGQVVAKRKRKGGRAREDWEDYLG
ncbi:MAG TPA: transcription termination factor NusA [Aggregatilineaceae bacterium]|nr:transcription termination factor NusA [Aggregatilineaceae bacterium]